MPEMKTLTVNGVKYDLRDPSKAPAGYGLGISGQLTNDWNETLLSGFYYGKTNSPDGGWWAGAVYGEGANYAFQHLYKNGSNLQKVRECYDGTWREWVDVGPSAFAPSGFGLGVDAVACPGSDCNQAVYTGWYNVPGSTVNSTGENGVMMVIRRNSNCIWQYHFSYSANPSVRYRSCQSGAWNAWANPDNEYAPSGYGLGEATPIASDLNACIKNGWYRIAETTTNCPKDFLYGVAFVQTRTDSQVIQELTAVLNNGATSLAKLRRLSRDSGATWIEEWVNPPMSLGVEYRTTERWNGKVVYTTAFECQALPNKTHIGFGITNLDAIVSVTGYTVDNSTGYKYHLPTYGYTDGLLTMTPMHHHGSMFYIKTYVDASGWSAYFQVKYTKN